LHKELTPKVLMVNFLLAKLSGLLTHDTKLKKRGKRGGKEEKGADTGQSMSKTIHCWL
jgi:hypothetical protein